MTHYFHTLCGAYTVNGMVGSNVYFQANITFAPFVRLYGTITTLLHGNNFTDYSCEHELSSELWKINLSAMRYIKSDVSILLRQLYFYFYLFAYPHLHPLYAVADFIRNKSLCRFFESHDWVANVTENVCDLISFPLDWLIGKSLNGLRNFQSIWSHRQSQ